MPNAWNPFFSYPFLASITEGLFDDDDDDGEHEDDIVIG